MLTTLNTKSDFLLSFLLEKSFAPEIAFLFVCVNRYTHIPDFPFLYTVELTSQI